VVTFVPFHVPLAMNIQSGTDLSAKFSQRRTLYVGTLQMLAAPASCMCFTLYAGGIGDEVDQTTLQAAFIPFGEVLEIMIPTDPNSGSGYLFCATLSDAGMQQRTRASPLLSSSPRTTRQLLWTT
jgi:hypothetical protein